MKRVQYLLLIGSFLPWLASADAIIRYDQRFHPKIANQAMVCAAESQAATIGQQILAQGGHAVDAAVAVGFALAVTLPRAGNLGGGWFYAGV